MRKNIKRLVAVLVVMAMIISMCSTAFAAGHGSKKSSQGSYKSYTKEAAEDTAVTYPVAEESEDQGVDETAKVTHPGFSETKTANDMDVAVNVPEGALPEGTSLDVSEVDADEVEDAAAEAIGGEVSDIAAVDISFVNEEGEIEPAEGTEVEVTITASALKEGSEPSIVHIKNDGSVEVVDAEIDQETGTATFTSGTFSTYALVWTDGSATITWGYMNGDAFTELEVGSTVTLDTTAATVSLENTYSGYYMIGASYKANSGAEWVDVSPARLTKTDNGWQITTVIENEDETTTTQTVDVADGSEIRVIYGPVTTPPPSGSDDTSVPSPTTEKNVADNGDGTYTITLDVTGTTVEEVDKVGANVLVVFDRTRSMNGSMSGASSRLAAAKSAVATLVNILSTGDNAKNDIDYSAVSFYRYADDIHTWGTDAISGRTTWTKNATAFNNYIQGLSVPGSNQTGTNWEGGLYQARQALNSKDNDTTYVIFLTDGEPNRRGTGTSSTSADTATAISYALTQARAITGTANVKLYGVFCGSDSGYNNLANMITNAGGVQTINGTDSTTLTNAFSDIAHTIVSDLGAQNVAVDDGVPSLSGVSANVTGEAGGYKYYYNTHDPEQWVEWTDAPGAIYSKDNGVTWDLSSVGTLPAGTTYRIQFTVWPSQAAYDLIADLNNGLKDYDSLPADQKAAVTGSKETGYTLVTNTHLNTTYSFQGTEYSDKPEDLQYKAMPLPTETVSVVKEWPENMLDSYGAATYRDPVTGETKTATEIQLTLQRDGSNYMNILVKGSEGWKKDDIYISCGNMTVANGVATIHEPGHDYQIVEPPQFMYYWDLISDVYHPMVINGTATLLVLDVDATADDVDNEKYFEINGKIYKKHAATDNTLKASNYRRSNLNITKQIFDYDGETAITDENAKFTYKAKVTDANSTDGYVWFSAFDPVAGARVQDEWVTGTGVEAEIGSDGNPTGYYYAPNGTELTMTIKAGWNVRFLNIYHGSTFSFEETGMPNNYEFGNVAAETQYSFIHTSSANWYTATAGSTTGKIEGTITEPNNNYTITYSNKVKPEFYIYHSGVAGDGNLETILMSEVAADGTYNLYAKTTTGTLYGGYYLDYEGKGTYADDGVKGKDGVAYTGMNYDWSDAQTVDGTKMKPVAGETYYIKEVPTYYLRNYHQINYVKSTGKLTALYLISAVDDLHYNETGFILASEDNQVAKVAASMTFKNTATNKSVTLKANTVFKSLGITGEGSEKDYLTYFDTTNSKYFANGTFTVLPYWITPDGITVNGISTRTITTDLTKAGTTKVDN